jgi:hypothetical protein
MTRTFGFCMRTRFDDFCQDISLEELVGFTIEDPFRGVLIDILSANQNA